MPKDRLKEFMSGFAGAAELKARAASNGYFIEAVILAATLIDGMLRIGLILRHQLDAHTSDIPNDLLVQRADDRGIVERQIYERARQANVINELLLTELQALYSERNRIVHRYLLTDITTQDVFEIGIRYERALQSVEEAIAVLEQEQLAQGVGMVENGDSDRDSEPTVDQMATIKHGSLRLAERLRRDIRGHHKT